jgi:hypothetical protein
MQPHFSFGCVPADSYVNDQVDRNVPGMDLPGIDKIEIAQQAAALLRSLSRKIGC